MPESFFWILIFIVSLAFLLFASERFVNAAEKIGLAYGIPSFILGVTLVAAGTSIPELVSSSIAVFEGYSEIVIGNVVGSNISNIFLVLGIVAVYSKTIKLDYEIIDVDLPLLIGSAFLLAFFVFDLNFSVFEAVLSLLALVIYIVYALSIESHSLKPESLKANAEENQSKPKTLKHWIIILISGIIIFFSADYTIESIIKLSSIFKIGEEVIALSAVSLGTSLPELIVSIIAVKKGNAELAVGNILGSNIFNSFAVMGIPAILSKSFFGEGLDIPEHIVTFSIPLMLIASFLYFFIAQNKRISRWEGSMLLIFYVYFIGQLFINEFH